MIWLCFQGPPGLPGLKGDPGKKGEKVSLPPVETISCDTARNEGDEPLNLSLNAGSCWNYRFSGSPGGTWREGRQRSARDRRNSRDQRRWGTAVSLWRLAVLWERLFTMKIWLCSYLGCRWPTWAHWPTRTTRTLGKWLIFTAAEQTETFVIFQYVCTMYTSLFFISQMIWFYKWCSYTDNHKRVSVSSV